MNLINFYIKTNKNIHNSHGFKLVKGPLCDPSMLILYLYYRQNKLIPNFQSNLKVNLQWVIHVLLYCTIAYKSLCMVFVIMKYYKSTIIEQLGNYFTKQMNLQEIFWTQTLCALMYRIKKKHLFWRKMGGCDCGPRNGPFFILYMFVHDHHLSYNTMFRSIKLINFSFHLLCLMLICKQLNKANSQQAVC